MATDRERFPIGSLDVNDGVNFDMESFVFTPAQKKPQLVSSGDSDGEALARESHYTSAYVEMEIRVCHQADTAAAIAKLGEVTDAVQACEGEEGGLPCPWVPNGTETTYTAYAISGDITELPIEVAGDGAGWFIDCPKVKVKLTLRPFLETKERVVLTSTESAAAPLQEVFVGGIGGDVPALGRQILTDESGQNRRFAQYGRDVVFDEEPPGCLIVADDLVTEGFSGEAKTRSGAYGSEKVKRATAVSLPTTICETKALENVGSFAVYLRAYAATSDARFRISYRNGDGPLIPMRWQTPRVTGWVDLFMGEVFFDALDHGDQASKIRIEHKAAGALMTNDVNYLTLLPSRATCKARGIAKNNATKLLAYDHFKQTEGALSGKALGLGGTWSGAGDTDDFTVIAADDLARRTAINDFEPFGAGRFAIAGSTQYVNATASVTISASNLEGAAGKMILGAFVRYADVENWLVVALIGGADAGKYQLVRFVVLKRVGGIVVWLYESAYILNVTSFAGARLSLGAQSDGTWSASASGPWWGSGLSASGQHADLRAGGPLEKGKLGFVDAWSSSTACTRSYQDFEAVGTENPGVVCYAGKAIEFGAEGVLRESDDEETWGQPDHPRGANLRLEPHRINRIVARMRRNDVESEADEAVTDKHLVEIAATELFLLPR